MKKINLKFIKNYWTRIIAVSFFILLSISYAKIFAIGSPYAPGSTLDPACDPGDTNCIVQVSSIPDQTGITPGYVLSTNGTNTSWSAPGGVSFPLTISNVTSTQLALSTNATHWNYGLIDVYNNSSGFSSIAGIYSWNNGTYNGIYSVNHSSGNGIYAINDNGSTGNAIEISTNQGTGLRVIYDGSPTADGILIDSGSLSTSTHIPFGITYYSNLKTVLNPLIPDSSTAIPYIFDTADTLSTSGAKLVSFLNNGVEKANIDKDGNISGNGINVAGNILPTVTPTSNITTVDSTGDVGYYTSTVMGSDGFARILYYDNTNHNLKFAQCTNANCTTSNITTVDSTGNVGIYISMAIGSDGFARISYYDQPNGNLKFVQCTNADCSTSVINIIDSIGDVGSDNSIAIGSDGFARISYYDSTNGDLKFAQCTNVDCSTSVINTIDSTGNVGSSTSIALGSDGFARISYYDNTNGNLKFAQCTNANCTTSNITTVDSTGNVGIYISMAIGSDGFARISYYDQPNGNLKFVQCTNVDCSTSVINTIDSTGDVGSFTSIAIGSDGFARISYYDNTNGNLKFAQCTNANCTTSNITTVDSTGNVGIYISMAIGSDGFARIAYTDNTNGDLKFFRATNDVGNSYTGGSNIGSRTNPFNSIYVDQAFSKQTLNGNFDLAENYPTKDSTLTAGYIASMDKDNPVFVKKADNENRIIGIVSTMPGSILGGYNDELYPNEIKVPIALSGRVPLKVNLENGPIAVGDEISLSSVQGIGKKAKSGEDTVGIALEPYDGSQSSILVFVHIQTYDADLNLKVADLSSLDTTSATSLGSLITKFLGDQMIMIKEATIGILHINGDVCVDDVCATKEEFKNLLLQAKNTSPVSNYPTSLPNTNDTNISPVDNTSTSNINDNSSNVDTTNNSTSINTDTTTSTTTDISTSNTTTSATTDATADNNSSSATSDTTSTTNTEIVNP